MKGFMHVVEVLLVIMLVFLVFVQFSSIPRISTEWSDVKIKLAGSDMISSLELQGVDWFNESEVRDKFNKTLPLNIIYNLRLENIMKPKITVGCFCDEDEFDELVSILSPGWFLINEENVTFEMVKVGNISEIFNLDFDVSFFPEYINLESQETPLRNFLRYDKGIVEMFDFENTDYIQENLFGLRFSTLTSNSNPIPFSGESKAVDNEVYTIKKYFHHIPIFQESFENLDQWRTNSGNPVIVEFGDGNSVKLQGTDCGTTNTWIYTNYNQFYEGEIDLDVYIEDGIFYLNFRLNPATSESYLASFSTNSSMGYDSFYRQTGSGINPIGQNTNHLTSGNEWHHMKIRVDGSSFELYNDGELVADVPSDNTYNSPGSIGMFHQCGEVYADNVRTTFKRDHGFQDFLSSSENVTQLNDDQEKILLVQDSGVSASAINYHVQNGKGRTAWLSGGGDTNTEEQKILIKSLIVWAAGDTHDVLRGEISRPVLIPFYKTYSKDMLQEVRIVLSMGYLY